MERRSVPPTSEILARGHAPTMNVLHAIGWFFPESLGGTEVYVASLATRLAAAGHSTAVVAPLAGAEAPQEYAYRGIPVFRYPIPAALTRDEAQGRTRVRGAEHFDEIVRNLRPDIVHFHTFLAGLGIDEVRVAGRSAAGVVATNHLASLGFVCQRGTLMRWGNTPCDGICRPLKCASCELQHRGMPRPLAEVVGLLGFAFRGSAGIVPRGSVATSLLMTDLICHNQRKQTELLSLLDRFVLLNKRALDMVVANGANPDKLLLNYLGTSHPDAQRKPPPEQLPTTLPIRIGYVGRLTEIKGILDLARAIRSLPRDLPFSVELYGPIADGESAAIVRRLREIAGADPRLCIQGPLENDDVPREMAAFDVLCVPSIWFENGPTVVSEAHAVGTPVIGTTIGAMPELIRHGIDGLLLEPGDWRSLAGAVRRMVEDPAGTIDLWRRHVPIPRNMDQITDDYVAMYRQLLAEKTAGQAAVSAAVA